MYHCRNCAFFAPCERNNAEDTPVALCARFARIKPDDPFDVEYAQLCSQLNQKGDCVYYKRRSIFRRIFNRNVRRTRRAVKLMTRSRR